MFIELYWVVLSCVFLCVDWLFFTLCDIFLVEGFPYKDQIEESFIVSVLLYVLPMHNIVNFIINFTFLTVSFLSKAQYSLLVLKVPLNTNQSINQ